MNKPTARTVKKIAVATLMLSAVASPVVANAATKPLSEQYAAAAAGPGQAIAKNLAVALPIADAKAVPVAAAFRLADPLELAKQYAPDTVPAWEKALEAYGELVPDLTVTLEAKPDARPNGDLVAVRKLTGGEAGTLTITAAAPVPAGTAITIASAEAKEVSADIATLVPAVAATTSSTTAAPDDDGVFAGRLALAKAAESKDADAIRDALAKLLVAYESQIEKRSDTK